MLFIGATTVFTELTESLDEVWQASKTRQSGDGRDKFPQSFLRRYA